MEDFWTGRLRAGLEHGRAAIHLLEGGGEQWSVGMASWLTGLILACLGEFDAALAEEAQAEALGRAIADDRLASMGAWARGWIFAVRGDGTEAVASCRRALDVSPDPGNTVQARGALGYAHIANGDAREAIRILEQAQEGQARQGNPHLLGFFMAWLSAAHRLDGNLDQARHWAEQASSVAVNFAFGRATARRELGRAHAAAGDLDAAKRELTAALDQFTSIEAAFEVQRTGAELAALDAT
jgi:tetratricopeptide (TPR) repeat protein